MRTLIFCFLISLVPIIGQSQTTKNTISLIGGAEYQDTETTGWNIEFNYERSIKSSRFYSEFGLNYSILEYNKMQKTNLEGVCGPYFSLSSAGIQFSPESGYYHRSEIKYSSQRAFRIQAGVNYHIIENSKLTISGGLNFVNQVITKTYQHGEYVIYPKDCADSLPILRGNISRSSGGIGSYDLSMQLQPHMDFSVHFSPKFSFTSRLAYYWHVMPTPRDSRFQLNVGLQYKW